MLTFALPRGRAIEVIATVNSSYHQRVSIKAPDVDLDWQGAGEGVRIGHTAIEFPIGSGDVEVKVLLANGPGDGSWKPSHGQIVDQRSSGEIQVVGEDARGALDGNDIIIRFRWVI